MTAPAPTIVAEVLERAVVRIQTNSWWDGEDMVDPDNECAVMAICRACEERSLGHYGSDALEALACAVRTALDGVEPGPGYGSREAVAGRPGSGQFPSGPLGGQPLEDKIVLTPMTSFFAPDNVFVIAEAGSNWRMGTLDRDRKMAFALIDTAADAGCDAVKFQTYRARSTYVPNAGTSDYLANAGIGEAVIDLFRDLEMPYELIPDLATHCAERGVEFMSTTFSLDDLAAVDPHVRTHKVASFEISDVRLLEAIARTGKRVVLSTGASTLEDVEIALGVLRTGGAGPVCLLQCTSCYPAPPASLNLCVIPELASRFGVAVGLSDHSTDPVTAPVAAVALGASVIEKHFTLHRALPGPDHAFALTPDELAQLVRCVRLAAEMRGQPEKAVGTVEEELREFARRTIQATAPISRGDVLDEGVNVAALRPGKQRSGAHPRELQTLVSRRATRDIEVGDGVQAGDWE